MAGRAGERIGGFRIVSEIKSGSGSQGTVYRAVCEESTFDGLAVGTEVALKVMVASPDDHSRWEKLRRRTGELVRLSHENLVRYYGCFSVCDVFNELYVVVQEYLSGHTLKDELQRYPRGLDVDRALGIVDAATAGLAYASEHGFVHRDIKPGNFFLCDDGTVKVIDFEIARLTTGTASSTLGNLCGSFDYMAPDFTDETFAGDVCSDVFSMGVVLHETLTGRVPYAMAPEGDSGKADFSFLSRWSTSSGGSSGPIRISSRINRLLAHANEVLDKSLAADRKRRYQDFRAFEKALKSVCFRDLRNGANSYRLLQFIGRGGFGEVFKARHRESGKLVAIKHLLKNDYAERFFREAKVMRRLSRGYFVQLVDFFLLGQGAGGEAFLVMEFLDGMPGSSLRDAIRAAPGEMDRTEVLRAFVRYAHGLAEMHRLGIFHRDIKPSNLYYPADNVDRAAIMDLGIARDVNGTATHGMVPGTFDYMPPEVVTTANRGEGGMDVFALGLCLYEALTGRLAYEKLPAGPQAYVQFFARAKNLCPPTIDAAALGNDVRLVSLLREMTEPELSRRIRNAEVVEARLNAMLGAGAAPADSPTVDLASPSPQRAQPPRRVSSAPAPRPSPRPSCPPRPPVTAPRVPQEQNRQSSVKWPHVSWKWPLFGGGGVALVFLTMALKPVVCEEVAEYQLGDVLAAYDAENGEAHGSVLEAAWRKRWSPNAYSLLKIDHRTYLALERRLEKSHASLTEKWDRHRERMAAIKRLDGCLQLGGGFNAAGFAAINGWVLPERLQDDAEIGRRCEVLSGVLLGELAVKTAVEPVVGRVQRIAAVRQLLSNTWTLRLLGEKDFEKWKNRVDREQNTVVGVVVNNASDVVSVDGHELTANGGRRVVVVGDGHPENISVSRAGYRPVRLPLDFNGREFAVSDADFSEALAVHVKMPEFPDGILCRIGDRKVASGAVLELPPETYQVVFSNEEKYQYRDPRTGLSLHGRKYADQAFSICVMPGRPQTVRPPSAWIESADYERDRKRAEKWSKLPGRVVIPSLESGVSCFIDGGFDPEYSEKERELKAGTHTCRYVKPGFQDQVKTFEVVAGETTRLRGPDDWLSARDAFRAQLLAKCRALLALEPVANRQERLEQAGKYLTDAVAVQKLFSQDEDSVRRLYREIGMLKRAVVGRVVNDCSRDLLIGGYAIPAKTSKLLSYKNGLPDEWVAELPGCERKELRRDLDGLTLRFRDDDFISTDVSILVPDVERDIVFVLDGMMRSRKFCLKPGTYTGFYRRKGFKDKQVVFDVPTGVESFMIPGPIGKWELR